MPSALGSRGGASRPPFRPGGGTRTALPPQNPARYRARAAAARGLGWRNAGSAGPRATTNTHSVAWIFCTWRGLGSGCSQSSTRPKRQPYNQPPRIEIALAMDASCHDASMEAARLRRNGKGGCVPAANWPSGRAGQLIGFVPPRAEIQSVMLHDPGMLETFLARVRVDEAVIHPRARFGRGDQQGAEGQTG